MGRPTAQGAVAQARGRAATAATIDLTVPMATGHQRDTRCHASRTRTALCGRLSGGCPMRRSMDDLRPHAKTSPRPVTSLRRLGLIARPLGSLAIPLGSGPTSALDVGSDRLILRSGPGGASSTSSWSTPRARRCRRGRTASPGRTGASSTSSWSTPRARRCRRGRTASPGRTGASSTSSWSTRSDGDSRARSETTWTSGACAAPQGGDRDDRHPGTFAVPSTGRPPP